MACYDAAAEGFGWARRNPRPGAMRDGEWLIGWGCATACYPTHVGPATVRLRLHHEGRARVQVAAHDLGTGAYTVIGQMAAERLGLPLSAVTVELGDSALPPAPVAGGSNTTASVCSALIEACAAVRRKQAAGSNAAVIEEYVEWRPEGTPEDAVAKLYQGGTAFAGGSSGARTMYAFGAEFVEVRVHARTREVRAPRLVGAFAGGRIMNPRTARSQLMGGLIWGLSSALHEATELDGRAARYVNDNIAEYLVPVNADVGEVEVILLSEEDPHVNPAGVKGLGELGNVGTAAAVANAVFHATGQRIRELPIRLEKLL
jgi:xanthine dehydrogenase YagR molybdenum-binding subunit